MCWRRLEEISRSDRERNEEILRSKVGGGPVPVAARSKVWIGSFSPAETVGSNPTAGVGGGFGCLL